MAVATTKVFFRGTTVFFTSTFYDQNNNVVQPFGAAINIDFPVPGGGTNKQVSISMVSVTPNWTAQWDSRGAGAGLVSFSVHSISIADAIPVVVGDGTFQLSANPANLLTF